jgi:hypothetical protein
MNDTLAARRLENQRITGGALRQPAAVVQWLGAVQAQEYEAAKWGLALRMNEGIVHSAIDRAFDEGRILRTHVMRPTWHFVAPADIRWLQELTAGRVHRVMSSYNRHLELDGRTLVRGTRVLERALRDGRYLTRAELAERLQRAGLTMVSQRLAHLVMHAELEGVICSGPRRDKRFTYALLAERAPDALRLPRDEALAVLARRFLRSHGPATIRDFVWWSGLLTADAKRGVEIIRARREDVGGRTYWTVAQPPRGETRARRIHLLPIYDEYLVAYRDREVVPHKPSVLAPDALGSVTFQHAIVVDGQVVGTWRVKREPKRILVHAIALRRLGARERHAVEEAVGRFAQFSAAPVQLSMA